MLRGDVASIDFWSCFISLTLLFLKYFLPLKNPLKDLKNGLKMHFSMTPCLEVFLHYLSFQSIRVIRRTSSVLTGSVVDPSV